MTSWFKHDEATPDYFAGSKLQVKCVEKKQDL